MYYSFREMVVYNCFVMICEHGHADGAVCFMGLSPLSWFWNAAIEGEGNVNIISYVIAKGKKCKKGGEGPCGGPI